MGKKVILIGIDGGTFDVILPMINKGDLPNLALFMNGGIWGDLFSTIPSTTLPAWVSCLSGVNPGKLGIFYLTRDSHATYDEGQPADAAKVSVKMLWHHIGDHARKVLATIPFPFPPSNVNGIIVTNVAAETGLHTLKSYPQTVADELMGVAKIKEHFENFRKAEGNFKRSFMGNYLDFMIRLADTNTELIKDASLHLMRNYEWDIFITVFKSTDDLQHRFWSFMDSTHPLHDDRSDRRYREVIFNAYRQVDKAIGEIVHQAGDATVIIVSDHGMGPIHKFFYANKWLAEKGFLKVKGDRRKAPIRTAWVPLKRIFEKLHVQVNAIPDMHIPIIRRSLLPIPEGVDWQQTQAYATSFGININLEGREPHGSVRLSKYDELCNVLRDEIYRLEDPATKEKIVEKALKRHEIYSGLHLDDAPDIVYLFSKSFYYTKKDLYAPALFKDIRRQDTITANHINYSSPGIFLAKGPDVASKGRFGSVHITDIAPTILYLMGLPIPNTIDGQLVREVFREDYYNVKPPVYIDSEELQGTEKGMSAVEEEIVKQQLRRLGYI